MARSILFLLTLALVAATNSKVSAAVVAVDEDADLAQRRETMAEGIRVFSNPKLAAAADSEFVYRMGTFMKREIGPLGPILDAVLKMPENSADDVRAKYEARDAVFELLIRHFEKIMPQRCTKTDDL
ncbi:unnamed protein product [Alopecurus aequalis]